MNKTIIALLAGVAIGILIAPEKGAVTRQQIIDGFDDLVNGLTGETKAWEEELQRDFEEADNFTQPIV